MGWVPNSKGGVDYSYVMNGPESDHTLPSSSETVPACIVICTQPVYTAHSLKGVTQLGGWKRVFHSSTTWKVLNARVQLVRYYAASSARVALGIDLPSLESDIPPPGLEYSNTAPKEFAAERYTIFGKETGTKDDPFTQEIRPEMEIEIWMGYLSKFDEAESYVDSNYVVNSKKFTKVFTGVIDTVDLKLGRGETPVDGVNCIITARDRMRFLIDTKIFGGITIPGQDFTTGVDRTKIVQTLISQGSNGACNIADELLFHPSGRPPMKIFGGATGVSKEHTAALAQGSSPFALLDQFPVDAIRWFSSIETIPRELYCDPNTGNIAWSCRLRGEPYKRTKDASLFGATPTGPTVTAAYNLDGLARAIKLANNYVSTDKYKINDETASQWATKIIQLSQRADSPKFLDPITFAAQIQLESQWQHITNDGSVNTSIAGALGLAQVMPNRSQSGVNADPERLKSDPIYNLEMGWQIMINKARDKVFNFKGRKSVENLYNEGKLDTADALMLTMSLYVGAGGKVSGTNKSQLVYVVDKLLSTTPGQISFESVWSDPIITNTETKNYAKIVRGKRSSAVYPPTKERLWLPLYNGWLAAEKSRITGTATPTATTVAITEDISVLRGEDNPWMLSYKKPAMADITWGDPTRDPFTPSSRKITPNILSAHSGWSTLGMITRFTLVTPQQNNSAGGKAKITASQSTFGTPNVLGITYEEAMALTSDPTSYNNVIAASSSSDVKNESVFIEPISTASTVDITNPALLGPTVAQPLKFVSKLRLPIRNRFLWDETSDETVTTSSVDLILNAMVNIHGKDLHTVDFMVPLNPDMRPSHMVRLHNMGFFNSHTMRMEGVIHMFSSGGVQNGCITMGVAVDPQGSVDPRKLPAHLEHIMRLQNSALDASSLSRDPGLDSAAFDIPIDDLIRDIDVSGIRDCPFLYNLKTMSNTAYQNSLKPLLETEVEELIAAYETFTFQYLCWTLGKPVTEVKEPLVDSEKVSAGKFNYRYGIDYTSAVNEVYRKANKLVEKVKLLDQQSLAPGINEYFLSLNTQPITKFLSNTADREAFNQVIEENRPIIEARNNYDFIPPRMVKWPFDYYDSNVWYSGVVAAFGAVTGATVEIVKNLRFQAALKAYLALPKVGPSSVGLSVKDLKAIQLIIEKSGKVFVKTSEFIARGRFFVLGTGLLGILIYSLCGWLLGKLFDYAKVKLSINDYVSKLNICINQALQNNSLESSSELFLFTPVQKELTRYFIYIAERQHVIEMRKSFPDLYPQIDPIIIYLNGQITDLKAKIPGLLKSEKIGEEKFEPTRIPKRNKPTLPYDWF